MTGTLRRDRRDVLARRVRLIVGITIGYNVIEAVVALSAGAVASSTALLAFGLDSTIEVLSAAAVAWQFTRRDPERWERATLRVIAVAFFALAAWASAGAVLTLLGIAAEPSHSPVGIGIAVASVVVMPALSLWERRTGRELGSASVVADSMQTLLCAYMSAAVLAGLLLNVWFGWWWADSIATIAIAVYAVREGAEAWRGDACATSVGMLLEGDADDETPR